ncbi:MAG: site-specific integrase [Paludibacteraceae bacterium]|nr:site-specific integrase [Paludibacteraceae bacterium]
MYREAQVSFTWSPNKGQELSSIKLRVTYKRQPRVYATRSKELLTKEEFNNPRLKKTKEAFVIAEADLTIANEVCEKLGGDFTFAKFKILFDEQAKGKIVTSEKVTFDELLSAYQEKKQCKPNTLESYRCAINWIKSYNSQLTVPDISPEIIEGLVNYISKKYKEKCNKVISPNTLGMYLRGLKALLNYACEQCIIEENPMQKVKIKHAKRNKRALRGEDWERFLHYEPHNDVTIFAHDFVRLSFAMCGANLVDILSLQNRSIDDGQIHFTRTKTERVDTNVGIPLSDAALDILQKYGVINASKPNAYILPYYTIGMNEQQKAHKRSDILKRINLGIKIICHDIGIEPFTTYRIRHTFAAHAAEHDIHAEQLMILLGHKNLTTTQTYLCSITDKLMDKTEDYIASMLSV